MAERETFVLFVPVSCVANLIGKNRYENVDDAIRDAVSRNSSTFAWREEPEKAWVADKLESSLAVSGPETMGETLDISGLDREQILIGGMIARLSKIREHASKVKALVPRSGAPDCDVARGIDELPEHNALQLARALGVPTDCAARDGTGMPGVKERLKDCAMTACAYDAKIARVFGHEKKSANLDVDIRIAIASSEEKTHDGAIAALAEQFGTTFESILHDGCSKGLRRVLHSKPSVAQDLPERLRSAAVSEASCAIGKKMEASDVDAAQERTKKSIHSRNGAMHYGRIYVTENVAVDIGGRVDGFASDECGTYVVESKRRVNRFLGVPDYERVQLELYMRLCGLNRCLHVESFADEHRDRWIVPDDQLLTSIVQNIRSVVVEKIIRRCLPSVGARSVPDAFCRFKTVRIENPSFSLNAVLDDKDGLLTRDGIIAVTGTTD